MVGSNLCVEASHGNRFHRPPLPDRRLSHWCSPISTYCLSPSFCVKTTFSSDVFILCYSRCLQSVILWIF